MLAFLYYKCYKRSPIISMTHCQYHNMTHSQLFWCFIGILSCFIVEIAAHEAIIGGKTAKENDFPYLVSVQSRSQTKKSIYRHICGGCIIGELVIITAASCVYANNMRFKTDPLKVVAGTNDMSKTSKPAVLGQVKKVFVPREYKPPKINIGNIAVLRLESPLELLKHSHLKALKLPTYRQVNHDGKVATFAGWGWTWIDIDGETIIGGRNDTYLRFIEADVIKESQCHEVYPERNISSKELCARTIQPDDNVTISGLCEGDIGGPLVRDEKVIGVLIETPRNCSVRTRGAIYTRLSQYLSFFHATIANNPSRYMREYVYHMP